MIIFYHIHFLFGIFAKILSRRAAHCTFPAILSMKCPIFSVLERQSVLISGHSAQEILALKMLE
jgi:hypothetical protein